MSQWGDILAYLLKRALMAAPFFAFGYFVLFSVSGGVVRGFGMSLFGFAGIITGAIIVGFPLARLVAESSGGLFWPNRRFDRPQPMYGAPRSMRARGQYEEAMAGFEEMIEEYPQETQAYVEMIDIAIVDLNDAERANRIYQRGMSTLKDEDSKGALAQMYSAIRSRLRA
jgi:tetratricopeptide (TPR) repeat protein